MRVTVAAWLGALCMACSSVEGPLLHELSAPDGSVTGGAGGGDGGGAGTRPIEQDMSWQYQLSGEPDLELDVELFVIDLFQADTADIAALHASDKVVVAYISAGTRESFRSDADDFPESAVGNTHDSYPDEAWLDIRDEGVRAVMSARMAQASTKGFDGVLPTSLSGYLQDTGFDLTADDQRAYSLWLATEAHTRGMHVGLSDDFGQVQRLAPSFDWAVHIGCIERGDCAELTTFVEQGKPVLDVETEGDPTDVCAAGDALGLNVLIKRPQFDAYRVGCL